MKPNTEINPIGLFKIIFCIFKILKGLNLGNKEGGTILQKHTFRSTQSKHPPL